MKTGHSGSSTLNSAVRDFEFQHHDGDDDGDDAVAKGF
jgi:hypothetical protein